MSSNSTVAGQSTPIPASRRPMKRSACVECHQRKIRCDAHLNGFPCSSCIFSRRPNCRIHQKKKRTFVRPISDPVPISIRTGAVLPLAQPAAQLHSPSEIEDLQENPDLSFSPEPPRSGDEGNYALNSGQENATQLSIHKGVRITYVGKDVSNINFLVRQRNQGQNDTACHYASDQIAKKYLRHESDRIPQEAFVLPDRALADNLMNAYFVHVNRGCPIVDEETFMAQYRGDNPADPPSLLLLQAIFLVGAHVSKPRPERDTLKLAFFRRAKMLFDASVEWNRDLMLQAALLLTWHSDGAEDTSANAWYWVGVAARIATGLGMHRDTGPSTLSSVDKRRWRRSWWILVQYDVAISLSYGRPQAINLDDSDVQPLTTIDFKGCGPEVQVDYCIKYIELCVLIAKVLRERFGLRVTPEQRKTALDNADEAMANWCLNLPDILQMRSGDMDLWPASLHLTYNNFLILLHRPQPLTTQGFDDCTPNDADICSTAANAITTIFDNLRANDRLKYLWLSAVNSLFTAMIQVSVELRFSNPVLAINARRRFNSNLSTLRQLAEYWIIAESTLRLFEESSSVQNGLKLSKVAQEQSSFENRQRLQAPKSTPNGRLQGESERGGSSGHQSHLDILAAAANAAVERINAGVIEQEQEEVSDWRQLFPFNEADNNRDGAVFNTDVILMENEWREMYWQDPWFSMSFGDGIGFWP